VSYKVTIVGRGETRAEAIADAMNKVPEKATVIYCKTFGSKDNWTCFLEYKNQNL